MSFKIIFLLSILILLLKPITSTSEGVSQVERRVESAIRIGRQFYQELSAKEPTYPELFDLAGAPNEMNTRQIWDYLRYNRRLFFPDRVIEERSMRQFYDTSNVSVMFIGANQRDLITAGLCIVLRFHLPRPTNDGGSANAGVMKIISIPIMSCRYNTGDPKVGYLGISINGVIIDPYGEFAAREYDLFNSLGFVKEGAGSDSVKRRGDQIAPINTGRK